MVAPQEVSNSLTALHHQLQVEAWGEFIYTVAGWTEDDVLRCLALPPPSPPLQRDLDEPDTELLGDLRV